MHFETTRMQLEIIMSSELSQKDKNKWNVTYLLNRNKIRDTENK